MNTKHTPGPWTARRLESQEWEIDAPNGDPTIGYSQWTGMVSVYGCNDFPNAGEAVAEANARLIAAAPQLLAALKDVIGWVPGPSAFFTDGSSAAVERARAAIAKAEVRE